MYTIFKNDTSIILTDDRKILQDKQCHFWKDLKASSFLKEPLFKKKGSIFIYDPDLEKMWAEFKKNLLVIEAGGGVVRNSNKQLLFIFRHDKWDLPKGKIEENESREEAALREVREECGVEKLELNEYLLTTYHVYTDNDMDVLKVSYWYNMFSDEIHFKPQLEEGITTVEWFSQQDLTTVMKNTYPNIELLIKMYQTDCQ